MTATTVSGVTARLPSVAAPIACGCCLAAGTAYVVADDPSDGGLFVPCPFRTLTGWWCPGCGLTRATHHLFRGDLTQALRYNLFVVVILAGLATTWAAWTLHRAGRSIRWATTTPPWVYAAAIVVLFTFALVRNLPGVGGLTG